MWGCGVKSSGAKLTFGTFRTDFNFVLAVFADDDVDDEAVEFVGVAMLSEADAAIDILLISGVALALDWATWAVVGQFVAFIASIIDGTSVRFRDDVYCKQIDFKTKNR